MRIMRVRYTIYYKKVWIAFVHLVYIWKISKKKKKFKKYKAASLRFYTHIARTASLLDMLYRTHHIGTSKGRAYSKLIYKINNRPI